VWRVTAQEATVARSRGELIHRAGEADSVRRLFGVAAERLRRLIPHDAAVWVATDPATNLPTAPTRIENMDDFGGRAACLSLWESEFMVADVSLYRDLARAQVPAAGLRLATGDRPARSARYREHLRPIGLGDELRAVLRANGSPWAIVSLFREDGAQPFGAADVELMAALSGPLGAAIRDHARPGPPPAAGIPDQGPGVMVFDPSGELVSINDDALAWLDELGTDSDERVAGDPELPMTVLSTLMRARAIAEDRDHGIARARIRSSSSGRWLVCHASCLLDPDGVIGDTALVIEPAKAAEVAPIIVQAYELSPREQQITQLIAHGYNTAEIAGRLYLSAHTVRDYVKAIFEKVGVSSRGELVATLFAEHYAPIHLDPSGLDRGQE
jgi:DNA-binding CsgD family transcriptional regulator